MSCSENLPGEENETTADMGNSDVESKRWTTPNTSARPHPPPARTLGSGRQQSLPGET